MQLGALSKRDVVTNSTFVLFFRCTQIKTYSWDNAQVILVGNKCDMEDERVISFERGKQLADSLGLEFFETSAKENINVRVSIIPSSCYLSYNQIISLANLINMKWAKLQCFLEILQNSYENISRNMLILKLSRNNTLFIALFLILLAQNEISTCQMRV